MSKQIEELQDLVDSLKMDKERLEQVKADGLTLLHGVFIQNKDGSFEQFSNRSRKMPQLAVDTVLDQVTGLLLEFEGRLKSLKEAPAAEVIPFKIKDNVEDAVIVEEPKNE